MKTRLCPPLDPAQACEVYRACLLDVFDIMRAAARQAAAPIAMIFACADPIESSDLIDLSVPPEFEVVTQSGGHLGARIAAAHAAGRAEATVVIGSDAPQMPPARLLAALGALDDPSIDAVCGPTVDGGYDLIGFRTLRPELLWDIPWSTPSVLRTTQDRAEQFALRLALLPMGSDIDMVADLVRAENEMVYPNGIRTLRAIAALRAAGILEQSEP